MSVEMKMSGEDEDRRRKKMSKVRILGSNLLLSEIAWEGPSSKTWEASDHGRTDQQYRIEQQADAVRTPPLILASS